MRVLLTALLIMGLALQAGSACAAAKSKPGHKAKSAKASNKASASKDKNAKNSTPPKTVAKAQEQQTAPRKDTSDPPPAVVSDTSYTSLVIDATGFKLDKCMSPKVFRKDGTEVWGTLKNLKDEDYTILEDRGMVGYVTSVEEAKSNPRCGLRPLIVKAADTQGARLRTDMVVSDADAAQIIAENDKGKFLEKFNVLFIRNEDPAPPPADPAVEQPSPPPSSDNPSPAQNP